MKAEIIKVQMDFRDYVEQMKFHGLLHEISKPVNRDTEAGAIMRYVNDRGLPGPIFNNVKGSLEGSRLVGNLFNTFAGIAIACRLPPDINYHDLVDWFGEVIEKRMKPEVVSSGECQQNVMIGDDVDITKLPAAKTHPKDGGRYLATLSNGICKDPESDWVNWGNYRGMIHDLKSMGLLLSPVNHGGQLLAKYHSRNQVMEYVQFYGGDPLCTIIATSGIPHGDSEVDVVGGIRGRPVKLVKCKTVDMYVPADAEIVIEGTISPGDFQLEGPFGEYPGYVAADRIERPVFRVSAVTYRDNPILATCCLGFPTDMLLANVSIVAMVKRSLIKAGIPISKVGIPKAANRQGIVVSTKTRVAGTAQMIANVVWADRNGTTQHYVVVVNDDIDPMDLNAVFHAILSKCNPATGIHLFPGAFNSPLAPYIKHPFKEKGMGGGNALFDCTWPVDWTPNDIPHRSDFRNTYPLDVQKSVVDLVSSWGLEKLPFD